MGRRKKKRTQNPLQTVADPVKVPRSFVIGRGKLPPLLRQLQHDLRKLMQPHTALRLKEKKRNSMKDFLHVAGPLGVTHFLILSHTENASYLKVARCPHGPTLTFKILSYSLDADIARAQIRPRAPANLYKNSPLIVLAGFGGDEEHLKLTTTVFQNIFPSINVNTVKLATCQRVVLLSYDKATKQIEFRHYSVTLQPVGVSRPLRKLVQHRKIPDLRGFSDVSEFVTKAGYGSESEPEDEATTVQLSSNIGRLNRQSQKSAVKLQEIGPRMTMQLVKVEEGLCSGPVIFHEYVKKTPEEVTALRENKEIREALRKQRRAEQEANVQRKEALKQAQRLQQKKRKGNGGEDASIDGRSYSEDIEADDDAEWYRQEIGQEPDAEFLSNNPKRPPRASMHKKFGMKILEMQAKKRKSATRSNRDTKTEKRKNVFGTSNVNRKSDGGMADKILSERKRKPIGKFMQMMKRRRTG